MGKWGTKEWGKRGRKHGEDLRIGDEAIRESKDE